MATPMPTEAIIDAAERLFGQSGVDGISLRKIVTVAGAGNHYAVQYHFGSKEALVRAIFARRLPEIEKRRGRLLGEARRAGKSNDPATLYAAFLRPLAEQLSDDGYHRYAAFLIAVYYHSALPRTWMDDAPVTKLMIELIEAELTHLPEPLVHWRFRATTALFLHALVEYDHAPSDKLPAAMFVEDAIAMASAALLNAPPKDESL